MAEGADGKPGGDGISEARREEAKNLKKPEVWMKVPSKKDLRTKGKSKLETRKPERPKRVHFEAVLIKSVKGVSYVAILKNLQSRVNPEELGVMISGVRETRTKDLLVEIKCAAKDRGRLDSAFRDVVRETGSVRHLVPTNEVDILDIDPIVEAAEIAMTVRSCLREEPLSDVKVSLTRKPFRGTKKAFVRMEEARVLMLLKETHIKGLYQCER